MIWLIIKNFKDDLTWILTIEFHMDSPYAGFSNTEYYNVRCW